MSNSTRTVTRGDFGGWTISPGPYNTEVMDLVNQYGQLIAPGETITVDKFVERVATYEKEIG